MLSIIVAAILSVSVSPADTTVATPSIFGVAKALLGFMSSKATTAEDSVAVGMLQQTLDAVEQGDRDGVFAPLKDYSAQKLDTVDRGAILPAGTDAVFISRMNPQTFFLNLPPANYSGIAPVNISGLEGDFLLVDDKSSSEGWRKVHLTFDANGQVVALRDDGFVAASTKATAIDGEGIAFNPRRHTVMLTREASNEILEFHLDGSATGRYLHTASYYPKNGNVGLESLSYNDATGRFWTATEAPLQGEETIRIQSYAPYSWPLGHWFYRLDKPLVKNKGSIYVHGISEICALDDGTLMVLEREANIPGTSVSQAVGGSVVCKLYRVSPSQSPRGSVLEKHLLTRFETAALDLSFANYEGMCLGPVLPDGRQVVVLIADSQAGYKGVLRDWFKTIVLN